MDTPIIEMIFRSGFFAKLILTVLAIFSLTSWGIILNRIFRLKKVRSENNDFMSFFNNLHSIPSYRAILDKDKELDIKEQNKLLKSSAGSIAEIGVEEYERIIADAQSHKGRITDWTLYIQNQFFMVQERFTIEAGRLVRQEDWGIYLLSVISSTAPFLGLLGTVWGIMNSFYSIGDKGSASLQVVAPGIAEALVTTIVGLFVAIPAVVAYNVFNHSVERIEDELDEFSDFFLLKLKRELLTLVFGSKEKAQK